jgi:hypothetical protein
MRELFECEKCDARGGQHANERTKNEMPENRQGKKEERNTRARLPASPRC